MSRNFFLGGVRVSRASVSTISSLKRGVSAFLLLFSRAPGVFRASPGFCSHLKFCVKRVFPSDDPVCVGRDITPGSRSDDRVRKKEKWTKQAGQRGRPGPEVCASTSASAAGSRASHTFCVFFRLRPVSPRFPSPVSARLWIARPTSSSSSIHFSFSDTFLHFRTKCCG